MKLHRTLLAIGLASAFAAAPAYADEDDGALSDSVTTVWDTIDTVGNLVIDGTADVTGRSGAVVEQTQLVGGSLSLGDIQLSASLADSMDSVAGNVGVNLVAGVGNAQANDVAMSVLQDAAMGDSVLASAMVFSDQTSLLSSAEATWFNNFDASVTDSALAGAQGNIGVNVAAGVANAQGNALAASVNTGGSVGLANADSNQSATLNTLELGFLPSLSLNATIDGGALTGATGNIQVNVAAGVGNLQHNAMAISNNR